MKRRMKLRVNINRILCTESAAKCGQWNPHLYCFKKLLRITVACVHMCMCFGDPGPSCTAAAAAGFKRKHWSKNLQIVFSVFVHQIFINTTQIQHMRWFWHGNAHGRDEGRSVAYSITNPKCSHYWKMEQRIQFRFVSPTPSSVPCRTSTSQRSSKQRQSVVLSSSVSRQASCVRVVNHEYSSSSFYMHRRFLDWKETISLITITLLLLALSFQLSWKIKITNRLELLVYPETTPCPARLSK